jgi:CheY-like chemotaxis protein
MAFDFQSIIPRTPIPGKFEDEPDAQLHAHILLVEDYPANVLIATTLLEQFGCTYVVVENGHEALCLMKKAVFDLVLMDVQMPIMNGFAATELIRVWEKELAKPASIIVGISAHALSTQQDGCIAAGMDDYMSKPYLPDELRDKIIKHTKAPLPVATC